MKGKKFALKNKEVGNIMGSDPYVSRNAVKQNSNPISAFLFLDGTV